jgi:8-oxo-dGTP diphosphatase
MNSPDAIAIAIILDPTCTHVVVGIRPAGVHLAGKHEFPGGKVEDGETPQECVEREAHEETSLAVQIIQYWTPVTYSYPDRAVELHPFLCAASSDDPLMNPWKWIRIDALDDAVFPRANRTLITRLKQLASEISAKQA